MVVVLISAMNHGLKAERLAGVAGNPGRRAAHLGEVARVVAGAIRSECLLESGPARFMPSVCELTLPLSLCEAFGVDRLDRLLTCSDFFLPSHGSDSRSA